MNRKIKVAIITGPTGGNWDGAVCKAAGGGRDGLRSHHPGSTRAALLPQDARLHVVPCDAAELAALPELIPEKADAFFHFAWARSARAATTCRRRSRTSATPLRPAAPQRSWAARSLSGLAARPDGRVGGRADRTDPCFPENGYGMAKLCAGQMSRVECQTLGMAHI